MSGFVCLYRDATEHPLFIGNSARFGAWFWLVTRAVWKDTPFDINGKIFTLERGQLCTSRAALARAWGWKPSAVERYLTRLKTEQMIGQETGQGRSIITICNYAKYQDKNEEAGQATGQASDRHRTAKEQGNKGTTHTSPSGEDEIEVEIDPEKILFDTGVSFLTKNGITDASARSIIGKWKKDHGSPATLVAIETSMRNNASEPKSYITACLKRSSQNAKRPSLESERAKIRDPILRDVFDRLTANMAQSGGPRHDGEVLSSAD